MKRILMLMLLLPLTAMAALAQEGGIRGKVVSRVGREPVDAAKVVLDVTPQRVTYTNAEGSFEFDGIPYGTVRLMVEAADFQPTSINVKVDVEMKDVNFITLSAASMSGEIDDAFFVEFDSETFEGQSTPSSLASSSDVFSSVAGYKFGQLRFMPRGMASNTESVYLNGIYMNDAVSGNAAWSLWTGLNEATRNQDVFENVSASTVGVGGMNGTTNILARASKMRQGLRASVVSANGQYRNRLMFTYTSGMQDNGWAYAFSASARLGGNDFVEGLDYNAYGYFGSVEKKFNDRHQLALTVFGVPTQRGAQMAATQEANELVRSNYYNPNVGKQNGKLRNVRTREYHEPVAMINHYFTPNEKTQIETSVAFRFGQNGYSALDWYDSADPKADYYRNLPSYYRNRGYTDKANAVANAWLNNPDMKYIDLDKLYNVNYNSTDTYRDGDGNIIEAGRRRSKYIIQERHTDQRDFNFKTQLTRTIDAHSNFLGGVEFRRNRTEYYAEVKDLLGGEYWLNVDNFAERDFGSDFDKMRNDINRTDNLVLGEGDKYGYDYYAHVMNGKVWGLYNRSEGSVDLMAGGELGFSNFWREGLYRKGMFPEDSFGNSEKKFFLTYTAKASATWNINAANGLKLSAVMMQRAPYFDDSFISPRTRNQAVADLRAEKDLSVDLTYNLRLPSVRLRASVFYANIADQTKLISFYDDLNNAFTNFAMSGIDQRHFGAELGFNIPVLPTLAIEGAVSWGDYVYSSNPTFTQTRDNNASILTENAVVWWKGMKVESTPQFASNIGLDWQPGNNIYISLDGGYYDKMYLSMNPLYRTDAALVGRVPAAQAAAGQPTVEEMMAQERFDPAFVMNASIGKTWYIGSSQLGFSLEMKNLLNNKWIRTGGFEQMRLTEMTSDAGTYWNKFDSKYYYLYGANYYLNVYFRF